MSLACRARLPQRCIAQIPILTHLLDVRLHAKCQEPVLWDLFERGARLIKHRAGPQETLYRRFS